MPKLKVLAADGVCVRRHELEAQGSTRIECIGRVFDATVPPRGAWVSTGQVVEVPTCAETDPLYLTMMQTYVHHVQGGALIAADAATADACGLKSWKAPSDPLHPDPAVATQMQAASAAQEAADLAKRQADAAKIASEKAAFIAKANADAEAAWAAKNAPATASSEH